MSTYLLIVEDEPAIAELVAYACRAQGFEVKAAANGREAEFALGERKPDLVILDWMLPDVSGVELLRRWRGHERTRELPVILLTARGEEADRIKGLELGADDYVVKPFSPKELVSRVRAVLRRKAPQHAGEPIVCGPLHIDPNLHEVRIAGQPVAMGMVEFKLLSFLASHPQRVFTRAQLLDRVWGDHVHIEERTVDVHILRLRKALAAHGGQAWVQTVRGLGYRFSGQPTVEPDHGD
ncbi:MAG TPA: phosphate regulon transcriptional regulator PhoB [Burkholderiaceae bacterium]|nr:phosphate regulon transcriptional regulator PhoB [Burkholderiaceae bacterium]